jgi:hypothetical protein
MIEIMFRPVISNVLLMEVVNRKYAGSTIDPVFYGIQGYLTMHVNVARWTKSTNDFFVDLYNQGLIGKWMLIS